jgi:ATP-dependent DNA ligase
MRLPVPLSLEPMEAAAVAALPAGADWSFEPKYDGFRCLAFRDGDEVVLQSRRQRPLARFFPEVAAALAAVPVSRFVLDGELVIRGAAFDTLQLRLHPAASRIARLSREHPATLVAFDLLLDANGAALLDRPFAERRAALEDLFAAIGAAPSVMLARTTRTKATAERWLAREQGLEGLVAKRLDLAYQPGRRAMQKYKQWHTIDCVVGGIYHKSDRDVIAYLLLGLYDEAGRLNYVGRCAPAPDAATVARMVQPLRGGSGFTGTMPGGVSRWSRRERTAIPLRPALVAEVSADTITAGKFRHGARLLRWRDDKEPRRCTMAQLAVPHAA